MMTRRTLVVASLLALLPAAAAAAPVAGCDARGSAPEALVATLVTQLQALSPRPYERIDLEPVGGVPAGLVAGQVLVRSPWPAARVAVELRGQACGGAVSKVVWFKAHAWRKAWVYGQSAAQDVPLAAAMPLQQLVDVAPRRLVDADLLAPGNDYLARPVTAGEPLRRGDLKPAPLVHRNERVTVLVQGRGVQLRAAALALQFGAVDDWIAVMVEGSDKSIRARVVAPGVVHVDI